MIAAFQAIPFLNQPLWTALCFRFVFTAKLFYKSAQSANRDYREIYRSCLSFPILSGFPPSQKLCLLGEGRTNIPENPNWIGTPLLFSFLLRRKSQHSQISNRIGKALLCLPLKDGTPCVVVRGGDGGIKTKSILMTLMISQAGRIVIP